MMLCLFDLFLRESLVHSSIVKSSILSLDELSLANLKSAPTTASPVVVNLDKDSGKVLTLYHYHQQLAGEHHLPHR